MLNSSFSKTKPGVIGFAVVGVFGVVVAVVFGVVVVVVVVVVDCDDGFFFCCGGDLGNWAFWVRNASTPCEYGLASGGIVVVDDDVVLIVPLGAVLFLLMMDLLPLLDCFNDGNDTGRCGSGCDDDVVA
jgi:hypothetical protein